MTGARVWREDKTYYITTSLPEFDLDRVHGWLSGAYWSRGIPLETVVKAFTHSLSFGLFHKDQGQVGCARMITDRTTFAYLADVYIDDAHRGNGLGVWLMEVIMAHRDMQGLRRLMLATADMHPLYRRFGFDTLAKPEMLMEKVGQDLYLRTSD
jgi:N-acetylglutamate synthase-like GNAT family acetyltransferase